MSPVANPWPTGVPSHWTYGHMGGLGKWVPVSGQFRVGVVLAFGKGRERPGAPFLPGLCPGSPFRLPSLTPWLCPAACTGSRGLSLQPTRCGSPLCPGLPAEPHNAPTSDGGRAHPAPPYLRPQLLVSPDWARSVLCGWRWGHRTGRGVPLWGYLHGPFILGSHHSPSPRGS